MNKQAKNLSDALTNMLKASLVKSTKGFELLPDFLVCDTSKNASNAKKAIRLALERQILSAISENQAIQPESLQ